LGLSNYRVYNTYVHSKYIIGIDEAGRGPIAGPVSVGLVTWRKVLQVEVLREIAGIRDSKKLSQKKREEYFRQIQKLKRQGKLDFANALVSSKIIDKKGIVFAIQIGLDRCLKKIKANSKNSFVYLDGGLVAPQEFKQQSIIKGDEKMPIIGAGSIVAKVLRDRFMVRLGKKYPEYGFEKHKGYGTKEHYKNIRKLGQIKEHRKSYLGS